MDSPAAPACNSAERWTDHFDPGSPLPGQFYYGVSIWMTEVFSELHCILRVLLPHSLFLSLFVVPVRSSWGSEDFLYLGFSTFPQPLTSFVGGVLRRCLTLHLRLTSNS